MTVLERNAILPDLFARWFASRGWTPRAHQLDLLAKAQASRSVLLIAPTGGGKTLAGFLPTLVELSVLNLSPRVGRGRRAEGAAGEGAFEPALNVKAPSPGSDFQSSPPSPRKRGEGSRLISTGRSVRREGGLHTLYISPLKALAVDIARNLERPVAEMKLPISVSAQGIKLPLMAKR